MRRTSEKITHAIREGKPPRRRRPRIINLATVDMTEEERAEYLVAERARVRALGYDTDELGRVLP